MTKIHITKFKPKDVIVLNEETMFVVLLLQHIKDNLVITYLSSKPGIFKVTYIPRDQENPGLIYNVL